MAASRCRGRAGENADIVPVRQGTRHSLRDHLGLMAKSLFSSAYRQLIAAVVHARKQAGLTQRDLASRLGRPQNYVGRVETEQRRLDFIELLEWLKACGVDAEDAVVAMARTISGGLDKKRKGRSNSK